MYFQFLGSDVVLCGRSSGQEINGLLPASAATLAYQEQNLFVLKYFANIVDALRWLEVECKFPLGENKKMS